MRKFAIDFDYDESDPESRQKMIQKANIAAIFDVIKNKLAGNYRRLLMEGIKEQFVRIRHELGRIAQDDKDEATKFIVNSSKTLEEFRKSAEEKQRNYEKIQAVSQQLNAAIEQVEKRTIRQMDDICTKLRLKVNPS